MNDVASGETKERSGSVWPAFIVMAVSGTIAGAFGWFLMSRTGDFFQVSPETAAAEAEAMASSSPANDPAAMQEITEVAKRNMMFRLGQTGLALGGILCCIAGALTAGAPRAIVGLIAGSVLGAGFGFLGGFLGVTLGDWLALNARVTPMVQALLAHLSAWGLLGAGAGLGLFAIRPSIKRLPLCIGAGLLAGAVVVVLQQLVFALAFPMENTEDLIPQGTQLGLIWSLLGGGLTGAVLAFALMSRPASKPAEAVAAAS